jgi:hypothetical protein
MILQSTQPSSLIPPSTTSSDVLAFLAPALTHSFYLAFIFQRLLSTTTLFVLFRAYLLSDLLLRQSFYASSILLGQSYFASAIIARQLLLTSKWSLSLAWRATETLRRKLFYELMVFVLGGGQGIILLVFWPGWLVIGPGAWCVMWACG